MDLDSYNLLDELRVRGMWWLPSSPEEKIPGTLTYDPESGVRLELDGVFGVPELSLFTRPRPSSTRLDLILGTDAQGDAHTLYKCDVTKISSTTGFRVSYLLGGKHFQSVDELSFHSAVVQYTHLESWSCFQFAEQTWSSEQISLKIPSSFSTQFKTGETGQIKELSLISYALPHFTPRLVEIRPGSRFDITFKDALTLRGVFSMAQQLGQLMTMLLGTPCYVTRLWICGSAEPAVCAFYPSTIRKPADLHPAEMCFALPNISNVAELIERWFASLPVLEPVYDLLFGTLFQRDAYVRTKFLNLSQALESFHRRRSGGNYMPPDDYLTAIERFCTGVPIAFPDALKRRLRDTLRYANEYSLRRRLKDVISGLDPKTVGLLKVNDVAGTADLIVKSRNYLTHFDEESRTHLIDDIPALHYMNERLTALLFILILRDLGMHEAIAADGVLKRRFFE